MFTKIRDKFRHLAISVDFPPVPEEDAEQGTNSNAYSPVEPVEPEKFLALLKPIAIAAERKYGVPACIIGGMACQESGYGRTRIGLLANNYFGIKWWNEIDPDGGESGRATYQLRGQPDENEGKAIVLQDLGEDADGNPRLIFEESDRVDNRYLRFASLEECVEFFCRVILLHQEPYPPYPDRSWIVEAYGQARRQERSIEKAALDMAWTLGQDGYCHLGGDYYREVIGEKMLIHDLYLWSEEAEHPWPAHQ